MREDESYFDDLASQGFPKEFIDEERQNVAKLLERRLVLEENWLAVAVFSHCEWMRVSNGMAGFVATGISSTEINDAQVQLDVPLDERSAVFSEVRFMAAVALPILRERAAGS